VHLTSLIIFVCRSTLGFRTAIKNKNFGKIEHFKIYVF
jgi:hypothetical protein